MSGRVTVYDLQQVVAVFATIYLQGFADGDVISVAFDEPQETKKAGASGDVVRVRNASRMATATVRLQRGSVAAAQLRLWVQQFGPLAPLDQAPFIITDVAAGLIHQSLQAWVEASPPPVFSADAPVEEWVFGLAKLETETLVAATG